jgi:hypothetical protein
MHSGLLPLSLAVRDAWSARRQHFRHQSRVRPQPQSLYQHLRTGAEPSTETSFIPQAMPLHKVPGGSWFLPPGTTDHSSCRCWPAHAWIHSFWTPLAITICSLHIDAGGWMDANAFRPLAAFASLQLTRAAIKRTTAHYRPTGLQTLLCHVAPSSTQYGQITNYRNYN